MGGVFGKGKSLKHPIPVPELEAKMVEAIRRRASEGSTMKSFNSFILKFPKIDENLRKCKTTFEQFDEDSNGAIDREELKHCFNKLEISFTEEEFNDLFEACDINKDMGMEFNEFIVLLCLVYLFKDEPGIKNELTACYPTAETAFEPVSGLSDQILSSWTDASLPDLETTFETLVDAFVFLDKNKDGYVSRNEMVQAINETVGGEKSSGRIAMKRFEEMDWDKNGTVTFKEFLFAFTRWVGIEDAEDEDDDDDE